MRADLREGDIALLVPTSPLLGELRRGLEIAAGGRGVDADQHVWELGAPDVGFREHGGEAPHFEVAVLILRP